MILDSCEVAMHLHDDTERAMTLVAVLVLLAFCALGGICGWLGHIAYQAFD